MSSSLRGKMFPCFVSRRRRPNTAVFYNVRPTIPSLRKPLSSPCSIRREGFGRRPIPAGFCGPTCPCPGFGTQISALPLSLPSLCFRQAPFPAQEALPPRGGRGEHNIPSLAISSSGPLLSEFKKGVQKNQGARVDICKKILGPASILLDIFLGILSCPI